MKSQGITVWLTGLSGAGKTTIAQGLKQELRQRDYPVELLDGDVVRTYLSKGLGFTKEDRDTNVRRIGFVASLLSRNGVVAIAAAISPYQAVRNEVRMMSENFIEVYVNAPLTVCEARDVKGLYAKARAGEIHNFTGIDDPYEEPLNPELVCNTAQESVEKSVAKVLVALEELGYVSVTQDSMRYKTLFR